MTLSAHSDQDICPSCGGPTAWRPVHPYPVAPQLLFGLSFVLFLIFFEKVNTHRLWIWIWTAVQVSLGGWLIIGRQKAKIRVLRCIRCDQDLR